MTTHKLIPYAGKERPGMQVSAAEIREQQRLVARSKRIDRRAKPYPARSRPRKGPQPKPAQVNVGDTVVPTASEWAEENSFDFADWQRWH